MIHKDITSKIISCAHKVFHKLGFGLLEKCYELSMLIECKKHNLIIDNQYPVQVFYDNHPVGNYFVDLIVNDAVIVECKAIKNLENIHYAQLLHYLRATNFKVGLLINFGSEALQVKRMVN